MNTTTVAKRKAGSELAGALALAVATGATWYGWLGWDTQRTIDPITQHSTGPYEPWQVVGCLATLVAVAIVASFRLHLVTVVAVMAVVFTAAWSIDAVGGDDSGLWVVGAAMIAVGMTLGSLITTLATRLLANRPL
ncbi:hypothetical protein OG394_14625 [Kribbella sp. NBC_01245]|uniref:hypothetical protein n=1 Tax=Kribbella sp. NBC_01245 TaxID=2903578 RepID=UPI002E2DB45F|nr:hypothetical protein [Kribbella sp. NBC_01245]